MTVGCLTGQCQYLLRVMPTVPAMACAALARAALQTWRQRRRLCGTRPRCAAPPQTICGGCRSGWARELAQPVAIWQPQAIWSSQLPNTLTVTVL
jgi:hypothetical protein